MRYNIMNNCCMHRERHYSPESLKGKEPANGSGIRGWSSGLPKWKWLRWPKWKGWNAWCPATSIIASLSAGNKAERKERIPPRARVAPGHPRSASLCSTCELFPATEREIFISNGLSLPLLCLLSQHSTLVETVYPRFSRGERKYVQKYRRNCSEIMFFTHMLRPATFFQPSRAHRSVLKWSNIKQHFRYWR